MIVGLTGGIASGKTFCTDYLKKKKIAVIDADEIARDVLSVGSEGLRQVIEVFGEGILDEGRHLNRQALRELVFSDDAARKTLNAITHPLIRQSLLKALDDVMQTPYAILSAPLLLENNLQKFCHAVVIIDVPEALQLERGAARDRQNQASIKAIMAKQMPRSEKIHQANYIIDNSGSREATVVQLECLHHLLVTLVA